MKKRLNGLDTSVRTYPVLRYIALLVLSTLLATPAESHERTYEVELVQRGPFESVGLLEIDSLDVGEENVLKMKVVNQTGVSVHLNSPKTTCGCVSVKSDVAILPDGQHCFVEVKLKPDRDYDGKIWSQTIAFENKAKKNEMFYSATITVRANLQGVFVAKPERLVFVAAKDADKKDGKHEVVQTISMTITHPVQMENLKVHGSPILDLFDVAKVPRTNDNDPDLVTLKIAAEDIPEDGLHGLLILSDAKSGLSRRIPISAVKRDPLRVVPSLMAVQRVKASDSLVAYGMLIKQSEASVEQGSNDAIAVEAWVDGVRVPVVVESKGGRIARLKLELKQASQKKNLFSTMTKECTFEVIWGSIKATCKCKLLIVDESQSEEVQR